MFVISAYGFVSTSGRSHGRLEPRFYIDFPANGIQDFDFVADPPSDMALMVVSLITAKPGEWKDPPDYVERVRVHARTGVTEALLSAADVLAA